MVYTAGVPGLVTKALPLRGLPREFALATVQGGPLTFAEKRGVSAVPSATADVATKEEKLGLG